MLRAARADARGVPLTGRARRSLHRDAIHCGRTRPPQRPAVRLAAPTRHPMTALNALQQVCLIALPWLLFALLNDF
jgi:hypothetical protein